jgi:dihydrofolate reductase
MAAKIVVTQYMSLDGVIEDPVGMEQSGLGDWTGPFTRGPDGDRFKNEELSAANALIFGRRTYEAFAAVWPHVQDDTGFAAHMNVLPKLLASGSVENANWGPTQVIRGDLATAVAAHKKDASGDTLIYGSVSIVHALAAARLIDEYRIMVYPVILGSGKRLFAPGVSVRLTLAETRPFNDGIVLLRYLVRH